MLSVSRTMSPFPIFPWRGVIVPAAILTVLSMTLFHFRTVLAEQIPNDSLSQSQKSRLVRWDVLNLNPEQNTEFQRLDMMWRKTYGDIHPQLLRDKVQLNMMLHDPKSREQDVMELRARINRNEERLHNEATWTFLCKKKLLTEPQRQQLRQLMGGQ